MAETVEELIDWLTKNTNEWTLEVNPHEGLYMTRRQYVMHDHLEESYDEALDEGENLYYIRAYPSTPISQYAIYGTELIEVLSEMKGCVEPHRRDGSVPMRLEKRV